MNENRILPLFDETFVLPYLRERLLPHYPDFTDIIRLKVVPYKKQVWETTYHVVIGYTVYFSSAEGEKRMQFVCSAHSDEPRRNVYEGLRYLFEKRFPNEDFKLPRPLFFDEHFNGTFYRAISGDNLLFFIKNDKREEIRRIVISAAKLFARLHGLPTGEEADFNPSNARIRTVVPGVDHILEDIGQRFGKEYRPELEKIYSLLMEQEEKYFSSGAELVLIHGDAHPENIIATSPDTIGLIDFTDLCRGDRARDLGSFSQQLGYKIRRYQKDGSFAKEMTGLFLDEYFKASGISRDGDIEKRIKLYHDWTTVRTATFWFMKHDFDETRAVAFLEEAKESLGI